MITVYGGFPAFGLPDFSPACLKIKTYLRMAKIDFEATTGMPDRGPTKKIPFVKFEDGTIVGDSHLIIEHLKRTHGDPLDAQLTKEQHALGHTIRRTAEESLYWTSVVARWKDKASFAVMKQVFAKKLPPLIGGWIMSSIRKSSLANAWGHGIGRHRLENIYAMGVADLDAIAVFLGDKPFLFGDSPTSYDAAVYGQVANALAFPVENPVLLHARSKTTLVDYCERISKTYFTDPP